MKENPAGIRAREKWRYRGERRPDFASEPGPGQESVWDYPRPPRIEPDGRHVEVRYAGVSIAETTRAVKVLETASPPVIYVPPDDVAMNHLELSTRRSTCEWKGRARYWHVRVGQSRAEYAAWSYADPFPGYEEIAGYLSFYPSLVECYIARERAEPQAGGFYGGWVTAGIVGPWKGAAGTESW